LSKIEGMHNKVIPIALSREEMRGRKRRGPKGRRADAQVLAEVRELLGDASRQRDLLIEHLHRIQDRYGRLSSGHLTALAEEMSLATSEVYEVASFYHHFDIVKEGEADPAALTVRVCDGLSCEMAGAQDLLAKLPAILGRDVRVLHAPCIGRCEQAPAAVVGQNPVPNATVDKIATLVKAGAVKHEPEKYVDYDEYKSKGGYALLRECVTGKRDVESVIATMESSGLRGLGGAGFPAGRKWKIVRAEAAPRLMAVNIDEGEPGTFKDRYYLERDPHRFLEGMLIAAWAVGIAGIYIYLRDEYHGCRTLLERELAKLKADPSMKGMPPIELRRGAGAYICGEESAMIESIEGKRGMPRLRPPYVAQVGLFGRPTLEHNFETLFWVRDLLESGCEARPRGHHDPRTDRRVLRRHGRRSRVLRLPARWRIRRHPARDDGRHSAGLRHAAALWMLHRLGRRRRSIAARYSDGRGTKHDALLPRRIVRAVHTLPQRHREDTRHDRKTAVESRVAGRALTGHARRIHLRSRAGRAESCRLRGEVLPA
jgi:formate dehydrogenase